MLCFYSISQEILPQQRVVDEKTTSCKCVKMSHGNVALAVAQGNFKNDLMFAI